MGAVQYPFQHPHVLAVAGPQELPVGIPTEPVDEEHPRRIVKAVPYLQPMVEVIGDVVAAERQHRHRVASNFALLAGGGGGGFGTHGGRQVNTVGPVGRLHHQRYRRAAPATENEGTDGHARGIFPGRIDGRTLGRRRREAGIGMGGYPAATGRPRLALPVGQLRGWGVGHFLPPDIAIRGHGHIGENAIGLEGGQGIGVGFLRGARGNAEEARFRIDGVQTAVGTGLDPGDIVTDRRHFPALESLGRDQHGEVGLAARAGERRRHIGLLAGGGLHAEDQHVLGQPTLVPAHAGGDAQGEALLAE